MCHTRRASGARVALCCSGWYAKPEVRRKETFQKVIFIYLFIFSMLEYSAVLKFSACMPVERPRLENSQNAVKSGNLQQRCTETYL